MPEDVHDWEAIATFYRYQDTLGRLPILCALAKKVLSAPSTSIYSERLFSEVGDIYEAKRSRLLPNTAENLLFLHHNIPRLEKYHNEAAKGSSSTK